MTTTTRSGGRILAWALVLLVPPALLAGCAGGPDPDAAAETITAEQLSETSREFSTDEFRGRGPAGPGEEPSLDYLQSAYREAGLVPMGDPMSEIDPAGEGEGRSYLQKVPMVGITADPETADLRIPSSRAAARRGELSDLQYGEDYVIWTQSEQRQIDVTAPLVFVGYGTVAPEENWDDYKGRDVSGAILVMLVNDPPLDDPDRFGGEAMTYYGRWTYKFEEAARQGAAGCLLIHTTESAGYGWNVVSTSWSGEQFQLPRAPAATPPVPLQGWVTNQVAAAMFASAGHDLLDLAERARSEEFEPVDLGIAASAHLDNSLRRITSYNVLGAVEGSDPEVDDETVVYTAHWDHLGVGTPVDGDAIYNGALDNATGIAALLEIAEATASMEPAPRRRSLFFATTAEEQGLLGAKYYVDNPTVPLDETLAVINIDGLNIWGPTEDVTVIGLGNTTLEDRLRSILEQQGRHISPDPEPEKGYYYRSDHFPFAKAGVPALYTDAGVEYVDRPDDYADRVREAYRRDHYHQPSDEFDESWDFRGAVEDVRALFRVGFDVAQGQEWPEWKEGTEFKSTREEMLAGDDVQEGDSPDSP